MGTGVLTPLVNFPESYSIGSSGKLNRMDPVEWDGDPRGVLWLFEPPQRGATYVMGIDVAAGITGWNRFSRVKEDRRIDNGAIEVVRVSTMGNPDKQVAEFAAPMDPFELGDVANLLGRMYAGSEEDQCQCIIEIYPGPGFGTLQRMMEAGYVNFFRWQYYADSPAQETRTLSFGWHASNRTNRDLWVKASRHIILKNIRIKSPWLVEEYANCRMDPVRGYGDNPGGHDDRVRAMNLAIWFANKWSLNIERTQEPVRQNAQIVDWQMTDMSMEEIMSSWGQAMDKLTG